MEVDFDGIVGPTHNYAGLSRGNVASQSHHGLTSRPRAAALQGLEKMKALFDLGIPQAVLPPHERPHLPTLRRWGFSGSDEAILSAVAKEPPLLAQVCSASAMWAANAATVAPSADTVDGKVHLTPANLRATLHRSLEPETTRAILARVFAADSFVVHEPLVGTAHFGDEGAANHTRLVDRGAGTPGLHIFAYGQAGLDGGAGQRPSRYPARQTLEASRAIARLHRLPEVRCLFVQQNPLAIDKGVFHNDVIAVGHEDILFHHEEAFIGGDAPVEEMKTRFGGSLSVIRVASAEASLDEVVASYLFNSQIVTRPDGARVLIAPTDCRDRDSTRRVVDRVVEGDTPIEDVVYLDVRQSMDNGGGPACLRLRVELTDVEWASVHAGVRFDDDLYAKLRAWVTKHYRETLDAADLADLALLRESRDALDSLTELLALGSLYEFQRD
jgi:succinylarginine dihydrolase